MIIKFELDYHNIKSTDRDIFDTACCCVYLLLFAATGSWKRKTETVIESLIKYNWRWIWRKRGIYSSIWTFKFNSNLKTKRVFVALSRSHNVGRDTTYIAMMRWINAETNGQVVIWLNNGYKCAINKTNPPPSIGTNQIGTIHCCVAVLFIGKHHCIDRFALDKPT